MTFRKLIVATLLLAVSATQAARTTLSDIGLSVYVPDGWTLSFLTGSASDTESTRMYAMINRENTDRAVLTFEAFDHVSDLGAHSWTTLTGYAESLNIQGYPFSIVYIDDSIKQAGLFAWRVYGRYGDFDESDLPIGVVDRYSRTFANGDIGWIISFEGDTADIDTAGPTYTKILDSVKVDLSFQTLPLKIRGPSRHGGTVRCASPEPPWPSMGRRPPSCGPATFWDVASKVIWREPPMAGCGHPDRSIPEWSSCGSWGQAGTNPCARS
ncbi:MAG: hypothetical protein IPK50_01070 [Fibrobacterota bacterium]|nr:MAG: hypothetical protein IPK50_01070 [Fibrobacterota bacterium]